MSASTLVELEDLALDEGAHLLIKRALAAHPAIVVRGNAPSLAFDLPAWCRALGHTCEPASGGYAIARSCLSHRPAEISAPPRVAKA